MVSVTLLDLVRWYAWGVFLAGWARMGLVDWTEQKIRNRFLWIWAALTCAGFLPLAAQSLLGLSGRGTGWLLPAWWIDLSWHVAVSAGAALTLWFLRVWPAGDVKLYCLLSVLLGLVRLPQGFHGGTLFLEALINIFLPAAAWLFVTASLYLWRTRFAHQMAYFRELGAARLAPYLRLKLAEMWTGLAKEKDEWIETYRDPRRLVIDASLFLLSMGAMSLMSYFIGERLGSPLTKTLVTFAMFYLWGRFSHSIGKGLSLVLISACFLVLIMRTGRPDWAALSIAFGHISVFTLSIWLGINIALKLTVGQAGYAIMPLLFLIPMLIPYAWAWLRSAVGDVLPALPALPTLAGDGSFLTWAAMGLFFGLSLVFVRIWDEESHLSLRPDQMLPRMTLGPRIVAAIEKDSDFADEFGPFYADGMTEEQVELLRRWCGENAVSSVPLAPTISFANWVYLGYFLTVLLDGHVLRRLY